MYKQLGMSAEKHCPLLGVLIDGFEEDPYLVHRKLALPGMMLRSSYGMASFLSCK